MLSARYFCQVLTKTEFHRQALIQGNSTKFHENPSNVGRVVPCERTDGLDEAKSHVPQICETQPKIDRRRRQRR
jgi:hypothetical protein